MSLRITLALLVSLTASASHAASGFFNMPTTLPQRMGAGWGPGYHAELVLKPYYRAWNAGKGVVRAQPHEYPPIYQPRVAYDSYSQASSLGAAVGHGYHAPPVRYSTTPGASRAFGPPPMRSGVPEVVPAEPTSPADAAAPDPLP